MVAAAPTKGDGFGPLTALNDGGMMGGTISSKGRHQLLLKTAGLRSRIGDDVVIFGSEGGVLDVLACGTWARDVLACGGRAEEVDVPSDAVWA